MQYANFNYVAQIYDKLCQFVFGNEVKKSQIELLSFIPVNATVLIVGGGTGWIIDEITKIKPSGLKITYVDISSKMIELSKKRNKGMNKFEFIEISVEDLSVPEKKYDVVLTPFFFDLFSQSTCQHIFEKLTASIKTKGFWLYTDFFLSDKSRFRQKIMIKIMYVFFRFTCKIEATKLPAVESYFSVYETVFKKNYCKNFIISKVFRKL